MSRKAEAKRIQGGLLHKKDARVRRTHERLGKALIELIMDKPMDAVTVQEVLDKASVGRSTFYLHFSDKNDLLLSQLEMFLEMMSTMLSAGKEPSRRLVPVTEMLEHVGGQNRIYRALAESGRLQDFFDLAQGYFARGIQQRLEETQYESGESEAHRAILAVGLSGAMLSLFRWWIEMGTKIPPARMDDMFHRIAWGRTYRRTVSGSRGVEGDLGRRSL